MIMTVSELIEKLGLSVIAGKDAGDREITGCYIGDLLSHVMGKAQQGDLWITIMNNINIVAVAYLCDVAAILLCEGVQVPEEVINKAEAQDIVILQSKLTAFELAGKLRDLL